jgi:5'-3' exonuclease
MENRMETNHKVLIVDGMALLFRAYYATSYNGYIRKTSAGIPTNAIYGFIQYLFDAVDTFQPTHVICCWDLGGTTIRAELYDSYKANRKAPPDELKPQFELVKEVVAEMGILNIGAQGYEADDCMGTLATAISEEAQVYILTGDHDMLQLISERIHVIIMKKGKLNYLTYDLQMLWKEKQLHPYQIVELKSFMGDTSDNYPGVKGIGEKMALKLLLEYQSVEGVLENLDNLPKGVKAKIEANLEMLHLSRDLATIRRDVPVQCKLDACIWKLQVGPATKKFEELEFGGLVKLLESKSDRADAIFSI